MEINCICCEFRAHLWGTGNFSQNLVPLCCGGWEQNKIPIMPHFSGVQSRLCLWPSLWLWWQRFCLDWNCGLFFRMQKKNPGARHTFDSVAKVENKHIYSKMMTIFLQFGDLGEKKEIFMSRTSSLPLQVTDKSLWPLFQFLLLMDNNSWKNFLTLWPGWLLCFPEPCKAERQKTPGWILYHCWRSVDKSLSLVENKLGWGRG